MKIYISAATKEIAIEQFIGKDVWVKVQYTPKNSRGWCEWYIRPLSESDGNLTFNICGTDIDWCHRTWKASTVARVLNDRTIASVEFIHMVEPLDVLSTEEIIAALYDDEFTGEEDFQPSADRGVEVHDLINDSLSYIREN